MNWFTTESLFRELDDPSVRILALRCMDYLNGWRKGLYPWSSACRPRPWGHGSVARDLVLPSGWMKRLPEAGHAADRPGDPRVLGDSARSPVRRGLVMTYPHYLHLLDQLEPDVTLYYNIDDYTRYWPRHAGRIRELERKLVLRATATVCVARFRADELRAAVPEAAAKIHHIPHGTPASFLAEHPARPPRRPARGHRPPAASLAGLRGLDRRPGRLAADEDALSEAFPGASIVIVGRRPHASRHREPWFRDWMEFSIGPNVHLIGWRPQANASPLLSIFRRRS